jgi:hypothetical protein
MEFMSSPPCAPMKPKLVDEHQGKMELVIDESVRWKGGAQAAVGGMFATIGARILRIPMPLPFKLVPLAFVGIGAGIGAAGAMTAMTEYSIVVERGKGITLRWKWGPLEPKELHIARGEIEAFEIVQAFEPRTSAAVGGVVIDGAHLPGYRLVLVTKSGDAHPIEEFSTETQAKLRKKTIKRVLRTES